MYDTKKIDPLHKAFAEINQKTMASRDNASKVLAENGVQSRNFLDRERRIAFDALVESLDRGEKVESLKLPEVKQVSGEGIKAAPWSKPAKA